MTNILPITSWSWYSRCARWLVPLAIGALLAACQSSLLNPPRLADKSDLGQFGPGGTPEAVFLPAPTPTGDPVLLDTELPSTPSNPILTVWVNEFSQEHERALELMREEFEREEDVSVELVMVSPALLPKLMETAILSDTLPDIVLHPVDLTMGWASQNILDADMTDAIIDEIGRDSFDTSALELVTADGLAAAIPSDGFRQILVYRTDWQEQRNLAPPDSYDSISAMAEAVFDPEALVSGLVVPTESNLASTQHVFEHLAAGNGCQLISRSGEVTIRDSECQEAVEFYRTLVNRFSPIGVQTDTSAQNAYLSGRTGMIISSPGILPKLAGLDETAPPSCPECLEDMAYLAKNSGIITELRGSDASPPGATFGELRYFGITRVAEPGPAAAFARYWFNQGYSLWLQVESEKKVPLRLGTTLQPNLFLLDWGSQPLTDDGPSLPDLFGTSVVDMLGTDVADSQRWGLRQGQGKLMARLHQEITIPIVLQEMLSGYFGSEQTIEELYSRVTGLIPGYGQ